MRANEVTGANAGGAGRSQGRSRRAAPIAQLGLIWLTNCQEGGLIGLPIFHGVHLFAITQWTVEQAEAAINDG